MVCDISKLLLTIFVFEGMLVLKGRFCRNFCQTTWVLFALISLFHLVLFFNDKMRDIYEKL